MKRKHLLIMVAITIVMIIGVTFLALKSKQSNKNSKKIETYTVPASQKVFIDGKITPEKSKDFYLEPSKGSVNQINVSNGQMVKEGEVLFIYKNEQITTQIQQLKSQISTSSKIPQIPAGNNSQANTQVDELKKQIRSLEDKEYTNVTATFDGKIYRSNNEAQPNVPIVTLKSTKFYVKGKVSEKDLHKINVDQPINISIISLNKSVSGKIKSIGDSPISAADAAPTLGGAAPQGNVSYYDVSIACDSQENLTDGFHVQAVYKLPNDPIKIPSTAVIKEGGSSFVYKVVNKKLIKKVVTVEKTENDFKVIKSGLKESETVVKKPTAKLKEGQSIE